MSYDHVQQTVNPRETDMLVLSKARDAFDQAVYKLFGYPTSRLLHKGEIRRMARGLLAGYYARHPEFEPAPLKDPPPIDECNTVAEWRKLCQEKRLDVDLHLEIARIRNEMGSGSGSSCTPT